MCNEQCWPIARFGLAAQHLGRFSGTYLVDADIPTYTWLTKDKDFIQDWEERVTKADALARIEQLRQEHPLIRRGWPHDLLFGFSRFWQERARFYEVLESLPKTLQHADSANKNLLARRDQAGRGGNSCAGLGHGWHRDNRGRNNVTGVRHAYARWRTNDPRVRTRDGCA